MLTASKFEVEGDERVYIGSSNAGAVFAAGFALIKSYYPNQGQTRLFNWLTTDPPERDAKMTEVLRRPWAPAN